MHHLKALLGAAALIVSSAANATVMFDFGADTGNLGDDHDYTSSGLTITASGYDDSFVDGELFGKADGGDERGIGLVDDPSGQNEIFSAPTPSFIQLDVSSILGVTTSPQFFMNSVTGLEQWAVYGSNTDAGGSPFGTLLLTGSSEALQALPDWGTYSFYDFYAVGAPNHPANVLIGGLQVESSVPEPATWSLMLLGFVALGLAIRRRRRSGLAQLT